MQDRYSLYESSQDMLICELDKLTQKATDLTPNQLSFMSEIVDIIKDLDEIMDNEDMRSNEGYSQRSGSRVYYNRGNSYRDGMDGRSYGRRYYSMRDGMDGYSRGNSRNEMVEHLYAALETAANEDERKRVQRMITEIENSQK